MQAVMAAPVGRRVSLGGWVFGLAALGLAGAGVMRMGGGTAAAQRPLQEAKGIFVPAQTEGEVPFSLVPVEGITASQSRRISFGAPFPRGWMTDPHRLRLLDSEGRELPIHTRMLTPWRDLGTLQMVPSARSMLVQAEITFPDRNGDFRPDPVSLKLEWGKTERDRSRDLQPVPVRSTWVPVSDARYPGTAGISEPAAYAVFTPEWYGQCVIKSRLLPLGKHPDFSTYDAMFRLMGETATNRVDPRVTAENRTPYLTEYDPWLYDRAMTLYQLAFRSGDPQWLREAHRATQFYAAHLDSKGFFDLKEGQDPKYSYVECLAANYWLTGDPRNLEAAERVRFAWRDFDMLYTKANLERHWTERHAAFKLLALTAGYELSGDENLGAEAQRAFQDLLTLQDNPIPRAPKNGALMHTALSHGDGDVDEIIASPWMSTLLVDAVQRYYTHSGDMRAARMVRRMADFFKGPESLYWSSEVERARRLYPFYLAQTDRKPRPDVWEDKEHPLDTAKIFALAYFFSGLEGRPDASYLATMSDLIKTQVEGTFPDWIRPGGVADGKAAIRVAPPRKYNWWFRTTADMDWLIGADTRLQESEDADGAVVALSLTTDAAEARPNQEIGCTLRYRNTGSAGASNLVLRVPLYTFNAKADVSAGGLSGGKETAHDLIWKVDRLGPGASGSVSFRLKVKSYPASPSADSPITPVLLRAVGYYCRAGHSVFNGCQKLYLEGADGTYCHTSVSNMVTLDRSSARR